MNQIKLSENNKINQNLIYTYAPVTHTHTLVALIFILPSEELLELSPVGIAGSPHSDVLLQPQVLHLVTHSEQKNKYGTGHCNDKKLHYVS